MAAQLNAQIVDCGPGNILTLNGSGLTAGVGASVVLQGQGIISPAPLTIAATFNGTSVTFTVPDGATANTLVVTASDGTSATTYLNVVSQYLQASQYSTDVEGTSTILASLSPGQLDNLMRDASAFVDATIGTTLRQLQTQEDLPFSPSRRIWPTRCPIRKIPIISLDALSFITSNAITTNFNVAGSAPDVYANKTLGYFEVQTYAVGNAILLGAIQTIGFSANVWRATYTAGYAWTQTPMMIRKATAIIATEFAIYSGLVSGGLGGLSRVRKGEVQYDRRLEPFQIPGPAMALLTPYMVSVAR